jgi:peroxiredoxin
MNRVKKICIQLLLSVFVLINFYASTAFSMTKVELTAPDFSISLLDGKSFKLSDYNDRIVVLIFGASLRCGNSRFVEEMANELATSFVKDKVEFIAIEVDPFDEKINDYIAEYKLNNLLFSSENTGNNVMWQYLNLCGYNGSITLPATFVIDQNRVIRYCSTNIVTYTDLLTSIISIGGDDILDPSMAQSKTKIHQINEKIYKAARKDKEAQKYYLKPTNRIQSDHEEIIDLANHITEGIVDDYEKVRAIHDWVSNNIYYDYGYYYKLSASTSIGALETLKNKYSVCQGYAELTAALLRASHIPCKLVSGYTSGLGYTSQTTWSNDIITSNEPNHVWNEAYVDGRWIILDATWDSGNRYQNETFFPDKSGSTYFDPDLELFSMSHRIITSGSDRSISGENQEEKAPHLSNTKVELYTEGDPVTIKLLDADNSRVSWKSDNDHIVKVSNGKLIPGIKGMTVVTAIYNGESYTCKVTVNKPSINTEKLTMEIAETSVLKVKGITQNINWSSSVPEIAAVDDTGCVTALKVGKTIITARVGKQTLQTQVTVKKNFNDSLINYQKIKVWIENEETNSDRYLAITVTNSYFKPVCISGDVILSDSLGNKIERKAFYLYVDAGTKYQERLGILPENIKKVSYENISCTLSDGVKKEHAPYLLSDISYKIDPTKITYNEEKNAIVIPYTIQNSSNCDIGCLHSIKIFYGNKIFFDSNIYDFCMASSSYNGEILVTGHSDFSIKDAPVFDKCKIKCKGIALKLY